MSVHLFHHLTNMYYSISNFKYSGEFIVVSHRDINLYYYHDEHCWASFCMFSGHLTIFFVIPLFKAFASTVSLQKTDNTMRSE